MKAQRTERPTEYMLAGTGKTLTLYLRENIQETQNADVGTIYTYDEYRIDLRNREGIEQYVEKNLDALMLKAKQEEATKLKLHFETLLDRHIEAVAEARGYARERVPPSVACEGYASVENEYQAEAIAFCKWKASLWPVCFQIQSAIEAGQREIPTDDEFLAEMPEMVWPE